MWKKYRKTALQEMRDYIPGEDLTNISVAPGELPKKGGEGVFEKTSIKCLTIKTRCVYNTYL